MPPFKVISSYKPSGDQSNAIDTLAEGILNGYKHQTLLGVTGSGKTFTMAKVIEKIQKPSLVLTHNKTLAAQLYREFKEFFPQNAVEYFVSYYDYYQPEAYVITQDLYIEKDASINDELDRLRLKATSSLIEREDVIIVSSVSCIYGIGNPESFEKSHIRLTAGDEADRQDLLMKLVSIHYDRNDTAFSRGTFRVRGDTVEVFPANLQDALRIVFFGDMIESICRINPVTGGKITPVDKAYIYPAKHYVATKDELEETISMIESELVHRVNEFKEKEKLIEAQRIEMRTRYDVEMLRTVGYCNGIENYSRIIDRRQPGQPPHCLLNYFKNNYLMFIDESHATIPQVRGMYEGDRSRKSNLVDYGFRLPSAMDNRPLKFNEFEKIINQVIFVSATPADYELEKSAKIVEQVIRPTGLIDPEIEVRPAVNQVDDLIAEIKKRTVQNERVLVTTLTKKMAEDLTEYIAEIGLKVRYLHSEIETIERVEIIRDLRKGEFDCLIGINLLREGLDIPEVSLVAILDADKEGFLRSTRSLIQTAGRAARNVNGKVIMYADAVTRSMQEAIDETVRRRKLQRDFNEKHNITPKTIAKEIVDIIEREYQSADAYAQIVAEYAHTYKTGSVDDLKRMKEKIKMGMAEAANNLDFERAAVLRDQMFDVEKKIGLYSKVAK